MSTRRSAVYNASSIPSAIHHPNHHYKCWQPAKNIHCFSPSFFHPPPLPPSLRSADLVMRRLYGGLILSGFSKLRRGPPLKMLCCRAAVEAIEHGSQRRKTSDRNEKVLGGQTCRSSLLQPVLLKGLRLPTAGFLSSLCDLTPCISVSPGVEMEEHDGLRQIVLCGFINADEVLRLPGAKLCGSITSF